MRLARILPVAAALVAVGCGQTGGHPAAEHPQAYADLHGAIPNVHSPKPSFTLPDTSGALYDFTARTRGKVTLLFFGYTHCPDECPTTMADIAVALRRQPETVARQISVVFVTTDPWRDQGPVLRRWLDRFDSSFVGLTGTPTQIAGVEVQMGMPISRPVSDQPKRRSTRPVPTAEPSGKYSVDHFAAVLVFDKNNRLATLYPSGVSPGDMAADMRLLAS